MGLGLGGREREGEGLRGGRGGEFHWFLAGAAGVLSCYAYGAFCFEKEEEKRRRGEEEEEAEEGEGEGEEGEIRNMISSAPLLPLPLTSSITLIPF